MKMITSTGAKCVICRSEVVAETDWIVPGSSCDIPVGPASEDARTVPVVLGYFCSAADCGLEYRHPPGMPDMEEQILRKMMEREENRRIADLLAEDQP